MSDFTRIGPLISIRRHEFTFCTQKIISFIEKYGVDFVDYDYRTIMWFMTFMTIEQIDVVFRYNPSLTCINDDDIIFSSFLYDKNGMYVLKKIIENYDSYLIIKKKISIWNNDKRETQRLTLSELIRTKKNGKEFGINENQFITIRLLIGNYEKRYYRLFDLLLPLIDDNNKKRRVY